MAGTGRKVWAADEILAAADLQSYIQDQVIFRFASASNRTSGILAPTEGMFSYLDDTNLLYFYDGSSWVEIAPNVGTAGTYTKVTTDAKGRVSSGTTLAAADIPSLDASKITSGAFDPARIPSIDASKINSGTIAVAVDTAGGVKGATLTATSASLSANINCAGVDAYAMTSLSGVWAVDASGNCRFNGYGIIGGQITSAGSRASLSGSYNALWIDTAGNFGIPPSSVRYKTDIVDAQIPVDGVLNLTVKNYVYKTDAAEFGDDAHVQTGLLAEDVQRELGDDFVFFNEDGSIEGIRWELLSLAMIPTLKAMSAKLDLFEARLAKLEK